MQDNNNQIENLDNLITDTVTLDDVVFKMSNLIYNQEILINRVEILILLLIFINSLILFSLIVGRFRK